MARKWVYEREKAKKQKIWNRMHEKDQVREDMLWKSEWGTPKAEKYPYRSEMQAAKVNAVGIFDEKLDYAKQAAAGWAQHQTDQVRKQAVLRDPNYQKWQQATGYVIEDDEDWHPQNDWSNAQNNNFGYLYSKNPQEARNYAALVNRENRSLRELGSQRVRTGTPERQGVFDRATDFLTDVWNRNSEAQATNSRLAMEQGLKNGERARKAFDSAGQSLAAQSDMNRQAADKSADAI